MIVFLILSYSISNSLSANNTDPDPSKPGLKGEISPLRRGGNDASNPESESVLRALLLASPDQFDSVYPLHSRRASRYNTLPLPQLKGETSRLSGRENCDSNPESGRVLGSLLAEKPINVCRGSSQNVDLANLLISEPCQLISFSLPSEAEDVDPFPIDTIEVFTDPIGSDCFESCLPLEQSDFLDVTQALNVGSEIESVESNRAVKRKFVNESTPQNSSQQDSTQTDITSDTTRGLPSFDTHFKKFRPNNSSLQESTRTNNPFDGVTGLPSFDTLFKEFSQKFAERRRECDDLRSRTENLAVTVPQAIGAYGNDGDLQLQDIDGILNDLNDESFYSGISLYSSREETDSVQSRPSQLNDTAREVTPSSEAEQRRAQSVRNFVTIINSLEPLLEEWQILFGSRGRLRTMFQEQQPDPSNLLEKIHAELQKIQIEGDLVQMFGMENHVEVMDLICRMPIFTEFVQSSRERYSSVSDEEGRKFIEEIFRMFSEVRTKLDAIMTAAGTVKLYYYNL